MDTQILQEIGLTNAEIKVLLCLIESGPSYAGRIVKKSQLQNAVVHRAFHSLAVKGLLTYIFEGKKKLYQPIEPKMLLNFVDEKRAKLEEILPEIEAKRINAVKQSKARIFQGTRGVREMLFYIVDSGKDNYYAYGGAKSSNDIMGEHFWRSLHKRRSDKGIVGKLIFHGSLSYWGKIIKKEFGTEVRITKGNFEEYTETVICNGKVGIIIWLELPYSFMIEEPLAARSYKKFFDILWKDSVKIS